MTHGAPVDSTAGRAGPRCAVALTYHEVTADPRVMKQARALARQGYDMHVICDWPAGLPENEVIDGVTVHRFRCFDFAGGGEDTLSLLPFLAHSLPLLRERFDPFARACSALESLERTHGLRPARIEKAYYKAWTGAERRRRKLQHLRELLRLRVMGMAGAEVRHTAKEAFSVNRRYGGLYQAQAILFAGNLGRQKLSIRPDIVHAHDIYTLPAGVMLAARFGASLVYDAHEYEPGRATKLPKEGGGLAEALEQDCFAHVDALVTVSGSIAGLYAKRYTHRAPVVVSNSPEVGAARAEAGEGTDDPVAIRARLNLAPEVPLVVFTGMIQREHRGVDKVVEALRHLPGYHLANMGPRDARNDKWFLAAARAAGVADRVHLLDPVDARDVPRAIASCDVSVVPFQDVSLNHRFAMPNKLFEAAFAGVPLCVSDLPEMRRFVEDLGIGRAMDQTDPAKIAEAIRDVCENPGRYAPTEESRRRLRDEYSWEAQKKKLVALYDELLYADGIDGAPPRPAPKER